MFLDDKLDMVLKEVQRTETINEQKYTEAQLLDILLKDPKKKKELLKNKEYAKVIKRFEEGGLL